MSNNRRLPGSFISNLIHFVHLLRRHGISVGTSQLLTWIQALNWVDWREPETFYHTTESVLITRASDLLTFRQAFNAFWWKNDTGSSIENRAREGRKAGSGDIREFSYQGNSFQPTEEEPKRAADESTRKTTVYSPDEILRQKDFTKMSAQEIEEVKAFLGDFSLTLSDYRTRRFKQAKGNRLDLRHSLHTNIRYGGEWLRWKRRRRRFSQRPLIMLADISGSMEGYSRLLLLFMHALSKGYRPGVEAFLFGTRLSRITPAFKERDGSQALEEIAAMAPDWSGGTRIGHSLRSFNLDWGRRILSRQAMVMIISDGWDRGEPQLLKDQMVRLQRSAAQIIWLNPLLGSKDYQAKTRGMIAALPHVDYFLPVHNLESLQDLAALLLDLSSSGSTRGYSFRSLTSRRIAA